MENRLCSTGYPTWQRQYRYSYSSSTGGSSTSLTYHFRNEIKIYEADDILFYQTSPTSSTIDMELYEPHELLPVNDEYTFTSGKKYMFHNVRTASSGSYYDWFFYSSYVKTATISGNDLLMTSQSWYRYTGEPRAISSGSLEDEIEPYTVMDESSPYFGYWCTSIYNGGGTDTIITNKDLVGGVIYNQDISSTDELIGGIACAEIKFSAPSLYVRPTLYYEVRYSGTDNWVKMGVFYLTERERQNNGYWSYTYRDAARVVEDNANRYLKLLYAGTDEYNYWNRYTLSETSTSGSITINPNSGAIIADVLYDTVQNQLTVDENNNLRFSKPINSVFRKSKYTLLRYLGEKQTLDIQYPTNLLVSNSLDIDKGKQGIVALNSTAKIEYVLEDGDIVGKFIEYEGVIYYVWESTSTSETNVCPVVYSSYTTINNYDVPEQFNKFVVGDYTSTSLAIDYYEPIDICKLCEYTHPYLISINDNVYYTNSRSVSNDILTVNYTKQYSLSAPTSIDSTYVHTFPDYEWAGNYYYVRTALAQVSTVKQFWNSICAYIGLSQTGTWADNIPFMSFVIEGEYDTEQSITYRRILSDIVQMCNGYGIVDSNNNFIIKGYTEIPTTLDESNYTNITVKHTPVDIYNYFQVNLDNQEDYMHYGMGSHPFYINNVLCTTENKYEFLANYFPAIAELFEDLGNWYKTEINLVQDYGIKLGDVITVYNTYGHANPYVEEYKTIVLSKNITPSGVKLSSLSV